MKCLIYIAIIFLLASCHEIRRIKKSGLDPYARSQELDETEAIVPEYRPVWRIHPDGDRLIYPLETYY